MTWRDQAACAGEPTSRWYPRSNADHHPDTVHAKAICDTCPVRTDCLIHAILAPERHGIWGGTTERQRVRIRRANGYLTRHTEIPPHPATAQT